MSHTFADLGVPGDLIAALATSGIHQPFDVQSATIPDAMAYFIEKHGRPAEAWAVPAGLGPGRGPVGGSIVRWEHV